jgi:hypothetical protein
MHKHKVGNNQGFDLIFAEHLTLYKKFILLTSPKILISNISATFLRKIKTKKTYNEIEKPLFILFTSVYE